MNNSKHDNEPSNFNTSNLIPQSQYISGGTSTEETNRSNFSQPRSHVIKAPQRKRTFKVIIIGDANVGKTCLSFRFCNGRFPNQTEATIGVDFRERVFSLDGELLRIQLWDTAGQERFRQSMVSHYYRNVHAVVFVYDMSRQTSFNNLQHWIQEYRAHCPAKQTATTGDDDDSTPIRILIGNKCDMREELAVTTSQAQKFADQHDMPLFETSAKADSESDHVESIFMTVVHKLKDSKHMHVQSAQERSISAYATSADGTSPNIVRLRDRDLVQEDADRDAGICFAC